MNTERIRITKYKEKTFLEPDNHDRKLLVKYLTKQIGFISNKDKGKINKMLENQKEIFISKNELKKLNKL